MREEKAKGAGKELPQLERAGEDRRSARTWHLSRISENAEDLPGAEGMERAREWTCRRGPGSRREQVYPPARGEGGGAPSRRQRQTSHVGGVTSCRLSQPSGGRFLPLGRQGSLPGEPWGRLPCLSGKQLRNARGTRPWAVSPEGRESRAGPRGKLPG